MNHFDAEFIAELFLDCDSVTTINRVVVQVATVINENNENVNIFNDVLKKEFRNIETPSRNILQDDEPDAANKNGQNSKRLSHRNRFYEETIRNFNDEDYSIKLRVKKSTVEALVKYLRENVDSVHNNMLLDKELHIFLFLLSNDMSFYDVGSLFGIQKSYVRLIFYRMAKLLAELKCHLIKWPSFEEQQVTRLKVNSIFQFPNCVGFIDTCRFKVGSLRSNKHSLETILLQGICDESMTFIDVHVGSIGTTKKNKVFKESQLSRRLPNLVDFDNHILGDSGYKLKKNLLTPFTSEELLTSEEMKFNEVHWKTRSYIGHTFEMLKDRFRKLNHLDVKSSEAVDSIFIAACVLHNFILLHEGCPEIKQEIVAGEDAISIDTDIVKSAVEKREFICNYINYFYDNEKNEES